MYDLKIIISILMSFVIAAHSETAAKDQTTSYSSSRHLLIPYRNLNIKHDEYEVKRPSADDVLRSLADLFYNIQNRLGVPKLIPATQIGKYGNFENMENRNTQNLYGAEHVRNLNRPHNLDIASYKGAKLNHFVDEDREGRPRNQERLQLIRKSMLNDIVLEPDHIGYVGLIDPHRKGHSERFSLISSHQLGFEEQHGRPDSAHSVRSFMTPSFKIFGGHHRNEENLNHGHSKSIRLNH